MTSTEAFRRIISGQRNGPAASVLRGAMRAIEPVYAAVVASRNRCFSNGIFATRRVDRPVVSIGNITTGGTGKTPLVRWLTERLRQRGMRPAILMRGYRARPGEHGDEERLLDELLNQSPDSPQTSLPDPPQATRLPATRLPATRLPATRPPVVIKANPDRVAGARAVLAAHPDVDVFILDDGFQHRRIHRDFDLVLIDATNPFGFGHLLPRGLLREPLDGLRRASAVLLTRVDQSLPGAIEDCRAQIARFAPHVPIYRSRHVHATIVCERDGQTICQPIERLAGRRVFAFCGIGNPDAFARQLAAGGATLIGQRAFGDHHHYEPEDLLALGRAASAAGAEALVSTEKDWVKLARLNGIAAISPPIWRVRLEVQFEDDDERRMLDQIVSTIEIRAIESSPAHQAGAGPDNVGPRSPG